MSITTSQILAAYEEQLVMATEVWQAAISKRDTSSTNPRFDRNVDRAFSAKHHIERIIDGLRHQITEVSASKQLEIVRQQLALYNATFPMDLDAFPALAEFLDPKDGE